VLHLGDYINEYAGRPNRVRRHVGGETVTLGTLVDLFLLDERQYRSDHACPGPWRR